METTTLENETDLEITLADWDITKHDGIVTLVSPNAGNQHRTFKISTVKLGDLAGKRIVSLLVGPDNSNDYEMIAFINVGEFMGKPTITINVKRKFQCRNGKPSLCERYADMLVDPTYWASRGVQYLIALRCRRCFHLLTHPTSLASGFGPECIKHVS